jgi:hypothetical protein
VLKSTTRIVYPARVFRYSDEDEKKMRVQFARLCVLYDDLMLEYAGADADKIDALDGSGLNARRFYFVRRQLGTLSELRQAIAVLNGLKAFRDRKAKWSQREQEHWDEAVVFFATNHEFLKNWRNDVGGHFLDKAAEFAIDNVEEETVGAIELYRRGNGADSRMKFAYDLVAVAMIKQRDAAKQSVEDFLKDAFTFLVEAMRQVIRAVSVISIREVWDRAG